MIIWRHLLLTLLAIICALTVSVVASENETLSATKNSTSLSLTSNSNGTSGGLEDKVMSQRRAARFDTAGSSPWVRVYNRPPGTKEDSFLTYETRGNTSAHATGIDTNFLDRPIANRRESTDPVYDLLRVKSKATNTIITSTTNKDKKQEVLAKPTASSSTISSKEAFLGSTSTTLKPTKNASIDIGYKPWSKDGNDGWILDDPSNPGIDVPTKLDDTPKDGSHWKVVGEGGEDGWQVLDEKGDVEWKIEYDDGEWRVTSTGDVPVDAEWVAPEYDWAPDSSLGDGEEYSSWSAGDYSAGPWVPPTTGFLNAIGTDNKSLPRGQTSAPVKQNTVAAIKPSSAEKPNIEIIQFGARKKPQDKDHSKDAATNARNIQRNANDTADDTYKNIPEFPLADEVIPQSKSWLPEPVVVKGGQQWAQGYGIKAWDVENAGWNSAYGADAWVTSNKDPDAWLPKTVSGPVVVDNSKIKPESIDVRIANPVKAWGTGYGSTTWKGDDWDSNVVWKTGFDEVPTWNESWQFPEDNAADDGSKKKIITWSQPVPSGDSKPTVKLPTVKPTKSIRIRWPTKVQEKDKSPPSRRTEDDSWGDDGSIGVVWKGQQTDDPSTSLSVKSDDTGKGWQPIGWKPPSEIEKSTTTPWKNVPKKGSNLLSVKWKTDGSYPALPPPSQKVVWNQPQWPAQYPPWVYSGCKVAINCGSKEPDNADDTLPTTLPSTTPTETTFIDTTFIMTTTDAPPTTIGKISWPPKKNWGGKSWKPPVKSWKPYYNPMKGPPGKSWKPPISPDDWMNPPIVWQPPPPIKWKKKTKNWIPPPGKSWKPPIATPAPDTWTTQSKPDCTTTPATTIADIDKEDVASPPQIIIITKLPNAKAEDKKEDPKKKPPMNPWVYPQPPRGYYKGSKNRRWPARPKKGSKPVGKIKGWPKGLPPPPPPAYYWPKNSMRRWAATKTPFLTWSPPNYVKSKAWRQMMRKFMAGL